jgi:shikimate-5-dehydrogenase/3-dehydroquinate dehydratase type I
MMKLRCHSVFIYILWTCCNAFASGFLSDQCDRTSSHQPLFGLHTASTCTTRQQSFGKIKSVSTQKNHQRNGHSHLYGESPSTDSLEKIRNRFHNYDRPILLIGCSSADNEIPRLAAYLSTQIFASQEHSQIVPISKSNFDTIVESVANQLYAWPDVLLLDMAILGSSETAQAAIENVAKSLYEQHNILSIYINTDSNILENGLKSNLEDRIFVKYSDYEICILDEGEGYNPDFADEMAQDWDHIEWELTRILARARLIPAIPGDTERSVNTAHLTMGQHTFFLSLTFPDIQQMEPFAATLCTDVDAMEYRTDLLKYRDSRFDVIYGMQLIRRYCRPHVVRVPALPFGRTILEDVVPIVYTVRTQNQAGTFPDDEGGINQMFQMLEWGLRGGVEVLDVESAWDIEKTSYLMDKAEERYSSQILGSHHVVGKEVTTEDAVELFVQCAMNGRAHGAKVVLSIDSEDKDRMAYEASLIATEFAASSGDPVIPNISLILGEVGQFSRIINLPFTPVTHQSLPFPAAPGQLTSSEIMTTRLLTKIFSPMKYAILGHNIAYSVSPQMHGAAFAATQLPHDYIRVDVATVEEFVESDLFKSDDFGGTSVTVPHKQAIIPYVDVLSDAAKAIGSVNTLIAKVEFDDDDFKRVVYGDNTDWKGIYNPLNRLLGSTVHVTKDYALIVGAGGTARAAAYVAKKLGLKIVYYNRTSSKAEELAKTFGGEIVTHLDDTEQEGRSLKDFLVENSNYESRIRVVISTVPAATEFVLPDWLFEGETERPIIFDVNYKPYSTRLLSQAERFNCSLVRGSEMLWEQGVGQFELWTGRTAPYNVMKQVVLQNCVTTQPVTPETPAGVFE